MTVRDLFAGIRNFKNYDGEFGVEIETETKSPYEVPGFFFWTTHQDGSLRDYGIEYVLKQPVKYEIVQEALKEFSEKTGKIKFIRDSFSTSVHVHINMLNESAITLGNFITTYFLFENLLIRYSGPNRLSNLFCLPVCDAEETCNIAVNMMRGLPTKSHQSLVVSENNAKYAALNLSALGKYGSLEIRTFRGETDVKIVQEWIDILNKLLVYSRNQKDPKDIMEQYRLGGIALKDKVFEELSPKLDHPEQEQLVSNNAYYAASVAYAVKNWHDIEKPLEKFNPTAKDKDNYAMGLFGKVFSDLAAGEAQYTLDRMMFDHSRGILKPTQSRTKSKNLPNELAHAWANVALDNPAPLINADDF